jgi:SNF2 family DNA or RNA helicase
MVVVVNDYYLLFGPKLFLLVNYKLIWFMIRYPEDVGGNLVSAAAGLPRANKLAKEEWLVSLLRKELAEGRNVLIFLWHKELADRLIGLCREAGEVPAFLDANKVQAKKRQDWIDKNVVGKRRIMITNPSCVQTGLNNLIWFSSAVFFENTGCNPFVARQAVGRLDRITQTKEVRVYWPVYEGVQCALLDLLQAKTAISQQIDGIDPTAALEMAGAGDGAQVQTQDVGLAVYKYLGGD